MLNQLNQSKTVCFPEAATYLQITVFQLNLEGAQNQYKPNKKNLKCKIPVFFIFLKNYADKCEVLATEIWRLKEQSNDTKFIALARVIREILLFEVWSG
jgi:hypothetical protein